MKNNKLEKTFPQLIRAFNEKSIKYDSTNAFKYYKLDDFEYKISISFNPKTKMVDSLVESITSKIQNRFEAVQQIYYKAIKNYPLLKKEKIIEILKSIDSHDVKPSKLKNELLHLLEVESIKLEETIYEKVEDYPEIFEHARNRTKPRKIIAYLGETNSGKTYQAMSQIANSFSAAYLAPLRLLALENYEYLNSQGISCSLITGEEKIYEKDAICDSCTVECFNLDKEYETIVIDEIQMIDDDDRGAFFIQAFVGANADNIIVTGPPEYEERIKKLAEYLGEEIEVHVFKRKSDLKYISKPLNIKHIKKNTAIIVFSRKDIFEIRKQLPKNMKSSVIYGALGYDVRKKQAEDYISGKTQVLISTDAIGMGLNLPIETILFTTHKKFNGKGIVNVSNMLAKQIAGRAGRYGKFDTGYYACVDQDSLNYIKKCVKRPLFVDSNKKFNVLPSINYIDNMLEKYNLSTILIDWSDNSKFKDHSIFKNVNLKEKIKIARFLEKKYPEKAKQYYRIINCPIDLDKDYPIFKIYLNDIFVNKTFSYEYFEPRILSISMLEEKVRHLSLLVWFVYQFPEFCPSSQTDYIKEIKGVINEYNEELHRKLSK